MATIIYIFALILIKRKAIKKIFNLKYFHIACFALFLLISIYSGFKLRLNPSWDMGDVFEIAKEFAHKGKLQNSPYLEAYPNNTMIVIIFTIIFRIALMFNITDFVKVVTLFNAIIITATVMLSYCIAKIMYGKEKAALTLIILLCTTPLYLNVAIYYTDALSMFFSTLILYLFLKKNGREKERIFYKSHIIFAFVLFTAWKIKITSTFVAIAIFITYFIFQYDKRKIKDIIIITVTICVLVVSFDKFITNKITSENTVNNNKMPVQHWIMLGLQGNGGFNQQLYEYTCSYQTYEGKKQADIDKIKEIINNYTAGGFIKHLNEKLKYAWNDGTYFSPEKLRRNPVNKGILHEYILAGGKYNIYYKYIPQAMHVALLIFIIFSCLKLINNYRDTEYTSILMISMLGIMVFLLIWENRSRYLVTMLPIFIILEVDGIDYFDNILKKIVNRFKQV